MAADAALGPGGFEHRTVVVADEAEGRRLAAELAAAPGWSAERTLCVARRRCCAACLEYENRAFPELAPL